MTLDFSLRGRSSSILIVWHTSCVISNGSYKGQANLSRGAWDAKNIHACVCVPLSFRNRSGSTFRVYRPCDFRWTVNLNSPFVQSSTCTLPARERDRMLEGRMITTMINLFTYRSIRPFIRLVSPNLLFAEEDEFNYIRCRNFDFE